MVCELSSLFCVLSLLYLLKGQKHLKVAQDIYDKLSSINMMTKYIAGTQRLVIWHDKHLLNDLSASVLCQGLS